MSKRFPVVLLLVGLTLLMACGGGTTPPTTAPPPTSAPGEESPQSTAPADESPNEITTITWWTEPILKSNREAFLTHIVDSFNAAHPDIVLEILFIADLDRVTRTAVQGGEGPDIIQSPGPAFVMDYVEAGHVLSLDDYAAEYGWAETIYPWAMDVGRVDGTLYSLPLTYETMVLFYNATLFEQMGWETPSTPAELETLAQAASDAGLLPFAQSNASWKAANEWFVTIFYNNYAGSQAVYEALTGERRWDDPLFVEAIHALKEYMDNGWFSGSRENYYTLQHADIWGALGDGMAAMQMTGTWGFLHSRTYFEDTGNDWGWCPLPPLREGAQPDYALGIGSSLSINAATSNPGAAAEVLDWLYNDPQRIARLASDIGGGEFVVPVRIAREDFPPDTDPRLIKALMAFSATFEEGRHGYTTWTFWPPATEQYIISGIEQVWNGEITPEEYCAEQQRLFEEDMAAGNVPPIPVRR